MGGGPLSAAISRGSFRNTTIAVMLSVDPCRLASAINFSVTAFKSSETNKTPYSNNIHFIVYADYIVSVSDANVLSKNEIIESAKIPEKANKWVDLSIAAAVSPTTHSKDSKVLRSQIMSAINVRQW